MKLTFPVALRQCNGSGTTCQGFPSAACVCGRFIGLPGLRGLGDRTRLVIGATGVTRLPGYEEFPRNVTRKRRRNYL